jgi:hypothetical protein
MKNVSSALPLSVQLAAAPVGIGGGHCVCPVHHRITSRSSRGSSTLTDALAAVLSRPLHCWPHTCRAGAGLEGWGEQLSHGTVDPPTSPTGHRQPDRAVTWLASCSRRGSSGCWRSLRRMRHWGLVLGGVL